MIALIADWPSLKDKVARARGRQSKPRYKIADVHLLAPVPRPQKILAIGLNYADHIAESGAATPEKQIWFSKTAQRGQRAVRSDPDAQSLERYRL